ncbi:hypothetical protein CTI12_AA344890 [Artemisia annua]|uniref:Uncharacterized protein n=1 Tax=Artemisia annua TaxID=35608 RepID=A0A2U1MSI4_ARTAN|nr:hypothetical protein CTI12_AA344890 [Artemisia annua]
MGFWNFIYSIRDRVQGITPTVKRAGGAAYDYTCTAASKIDQVVKWMDNNSKGLPSDKDQVEKWGFGISYTRSETEDHTDIETCSFCLSRATDLLLYVWTFVGASVATKLISDTMREVKQERDKDGMKAKVTRLEEDFRSSKSQLEVEIVSQNRHLILQNACANKAKDMINVFMVTEFVQNHMVCDIMVSKIACKEKKNE